MFFQFDSLDNVSTQSRKYSEKAVRDGSRVITPAMTETSHLIFSTNLLRSTPLIQLSENSTTVPLKTIVSSRRKASLILLSIASTLIPSTSASAFSVGIPGPKEWLKDQKKKSSRFLLAPIQASRESLQTAYRVLITSVELIVEEESGNVDGDEIRKLLNSAARDCVVEERNSVVSFQARTGVEVCTFRLLVNNAASLLDENDPVKMETEAMLDQLIRSFSSLGDTVESGDLQIASNREKAEDALKETMSTLDSFEQGIKDCIGM